MVKSRVTNTSEAYLQLYRDLKFDVENGIVYVPKKFWDDRVILKTHDDYTYFLNELAQFTLEPEFLELVTLRYGLIDGEAHTLKECGKILNVSDECVRSRITRSIRKLRHSLNLKGVINRLKLSERGLELLENSSRNED